MQGSAEYPYRLELCLDPPSISCTCQAAIMGIPCKHRLHVVNGHTYDLIGLTPEIEQAISIFSEIMAKSEMSTYLKDYENAKNAVKITDTNTEKAFKKYKKAVIAHALSKGTEKAAKKASAELDEVMQDCVNVAAETESLIQALRTVFVRPSSQEDTEEIVDEALES